MRSLRWLTVALALLWCAPLRAMPPGSNNTERQVDDQVFSVHVDIASQIDFIELQLYMEEARRLLQRSLGGTDAACCMNINPTSLVTFGSPGDGLDIIDNSTEWGQIPAGTKALVMSINWCGSAGSGIVGCAETPGNKLMVALDSNLDVLGMALAHERGHNAGLTHRQDESCALMYPIAGSSHGCMTVSECSAMRGLGTHQGDCGCLDPVIGNPIVANGTSCTENGIPGACTNEGLCSPVPENDLCADATVVGDGAVLSTNERASGDGDASCQTTSTDVWYSYVPPCSGSVEANLCDSGFDTVLSIHDDCPGDLLNESMCNDQCASIPGCRTKASCLTAPVVYGVPTLLRVGRGPGGPDPFVLRTSCVENPALDSDGDGLEDVLEYGTYGTSPSDPDTDGDLLSDGDEVLTHGTNPLLADSDGDGLDDGQEINVYGSDANDPDTDNDGLDDGDEIGPGADTDGDMIINVLDPDSDDDTVLDGSDNCVLVANSGQEDDGGVISLADPNATAPDGIGNACQCGDVSNDGRVNGTDMYVLSTSLAYPPLPLSPTALAKCVANPGSSACDVGQLALYRRLVLMPGGPPDAQQICDAAILP